MSVLQLKQYIAHQQQHLSELGLSALDQPFLRLQEHSHEHAHENTGFLLLHGSAATPCNHRELGEALYRRGFNVFASLLAGHHDLNALHQGSTSWQDCLSGVQADFDAFKQVCKQVYVVGSSFGGTLAYLLPPQHQLAGIVALSAPVIANDGWEPADPWGVEVKQAIVAADQHLPHFTLPLLVGHALDDTLVHPENAFSSFSRVASAQKKLLMYHGVAHGLGFAHNTEELAADMAAFATHHEPLQEVTFYCEDRGYDQVAIAGSFNNWKPVALSPTSSTQTPSERRWQTPLWLAPGTYSYKLVINGQHWILDPDAPVKVAPHGEQNSTFSISL